MLFFGLYISRNAGVIFLCLLIIIALAIKGMYDIVSSANVLVPDLGGANPPSIWENAFTAVTVAHPDFALAEIPSLVAWYFPWVFTSCLLLSGNRRTRLGARTMLLLGGLYTIAWVAYYWREFYYEGRAWSPAVFYVTVKLP